jgi:small conductance mechanosensitive channel
MGVPIVDYINSLDPFARHAIWILIVGIITIFVERSIRLLLRHRFKKGSHILQVDPTQYNFLKNSISILIYVIGIGVAIYIVPSLRTLAVSMLAGAGILAVIIGFASQQALSNVVSGIMIVLFKPFRVGDWITLESGTAGNIEDITLRHTVIRTRENKRVIVPTTIMGDEKLENAHIAEEAVCRFVEIGIAYDADIDHATVIMRDEAKKHPYFHDYRTEEEKNGGVDAVRVAVIGFGDSSVNLRAWVWAKTPDEGYRMHLDLNKRIKQRFDKEGVEIPFPYRTIVYKKDITPTKEKSVQKKRTKTQ